MSNAKNLIIYRKSPLYPLSGKALVIGQIYEGSDRNLYVAAGQLKLEGGHELLAVGLGNEDYVDDSLDGEQITFRECKVKMRVD